MLKNSVLYHRLWYVKKRNSRRLHVCVKLMAILIILICFVSYANKMMSPSIIGISEYRARSIVASAVNDAVKSAFTDDFKYEDVAFVSRDEAGNVTDVQIDVQKLSKLSVEISSFIREKLGTAGKQRISVPLGTLLGSSLLAGTGPNIYISVLPYGNVETEFKSEFDSQGTNQTRHRIYLSINTEVGIAGLFTNKKIIVSTSIPVIETVIVGKVPESIQANSAGK